MILSSCVVGLPCGAQAAPAYKTLVDPNVLITRAPPASFLEPYIATDPRDARRLVVGAVGIEQFGRRSRAFWSRDGGNTWSESALPRQSSGGDPYVAFGPRGAAYFATLKNELDSARKPVRGLDVYRSADGGESWEAPLRLFTGHSTDYEKIAVDVNGRRDADRVFVVTKGPGGDSTLRGSFLLRSDDGARSFGAPARVHREALHVSSLILQRDGTVLLPYYGANVRDTADPANTNIVVVRSSDQGKSFSKPMAVARYDESCLRRAPPEPGRWAFFPAHSLAVDRSTSTYANRIYEVWNDCRFGQSRILTAWSADGGMSWSQPKRVAAEIPDSAVQSLPSIDVNKDGVVGVTWLDTRHSERRDKFDAYFAASVDGGESFLPSVRVSSASSAPWSAGNLALSLAEVTRAWSTYSAGRKEGITAFMNSPFAFRPEGGDYLGLASDADGGFHYAWSDSRTGSMQIWTSRIRVERAQREKASSSKGETSRDVTDSMMVEFDHLAYDVETKQQVLWVRLRNVSANAICGPLMLEFTGWDYATVQLTNADNGKVGEGATFDYTRALRDLDRLPPSGVTEPIAWRTTSSTMGFGGSTISFVAKIMGGVCR